MTESRASMTDIDVRPVTPERWPDLERLFGPRGAYSGCWCMWWRLARSESSRQPAEARRQGLKEIVDAGRVPGLLAYLDGEPAAWCSIAPREEFPPLERSRTLKRVDDTPVWSIVCFYVGKAYRRRGIMVPLIQAAARYAADHGAAMVEAYPVDPGEKRVSSASAYTGIAAAFVQAGFVEVARRSPSHPIMRLAVDGR